MTKKILIKSNEDILGKYNNNKTRSIILIYKIKLHNCIKQYGSQQKNSMYLKLITLNHNDETFDIRTMDNLNGHI